MGANKELLQKLRAYLAFLKRSNSRDANVGTTGHVHGSNSKDDPEIVRYIKDFMQHQNEILTDLQGNQTSPQEQIKDYVKLSKLNDQHSQNLKNLNDKKSKLTNLLGKKAQLLKNKE